MPSPKLALTLALALQICTRSAPAEITALESADALHAHASRLADEERYLEAVSAYRGAIRLLEESRGTHSQLLASPWNNLAIAYRRLGRSREALDCYRRSLEIRDSPLVRVNLARLYQQTGRAGQARILFEQVLGKLSPSAEPELEAAARHNYAALLLASGSLDAAAAEAREAMLLWRLARRHADEAKAMAMHAEILRRSRRHREAAPAFAPRDRESAARARGPPPGSRPYARRL